MQDAPPRKIVIVDIDGTLADNNHRRHLIRTRPGCHRKVEADWHDFNEACLDDKPIPNMCEMVEALAQDFVIIFVTSRPESIREKTEFWLGMHVRYAVTTPGARLLMRPNDCNTVARGLKLGLISAAGIMSSSIAFALEDDPVVAMAYRSAGIRCLQVLPL